MQHMTCVGKTRDAVGLIIGYELRDLRTSQIKAYSSEYLLSAVQNQEIEVNNLYIDPMTGEFLPVGMKPAEPEVHVPEVSEDKPAAKKMTRRRKTRSKKSSRRKR